MPVTTAKERLNKMLKRGKTTVKEEPTFSPTPGKGMNSVTQELVEPIPTKVKREETIEKFMQRRNKEEGKIPRGII